MLYISFSLHQAVVIKTTLQIKTITAIYFQNGLKGDDSGALRSNVVERCVLLWRDYTSEQKNKERINTLTRAIKEMGKQELSDGIMERYTNHQEISADIFA